MKKANKILSLFLVLAVCIGMFSGIPAFAANSDSDFDTGSLSSYGGGTYVSHYFGKDTKISIPDGVTAILQMSAEKVTDISIPASVSHISIDVCREDRSEADRSRAYGSFGSCPDLKNIFVNHNNPNYCDVKGVLYTKDMNTLVSFPAKNSQKSYTIPDSVTSIKDLTFKFSTLTSIVIPQSVTEIGKNVFSYAGNLTDLTFGADCDTTDTLFGYINTLKKVKIGSSVPKIGDRMFISCTNLSDLQIEPGISSIGKETFRTCYGLTKVTLPNTVTSIGEMAFLDCRNLTDITIPDSVTEIGTDALTTGGTVTIHCSANSYAEQYAKENGLNFQVGNSSVTTPSIGQDYNSKLEAAIDKAFTGITPNMSDLEKALVIHDYIATLANYDYSFSNGSAYDLLVNRNGVCQSYVEAYSLLMNRLGIQTTVVTNITLNHAWNKIKIGEKWYTVDVTWDDMGDDIRYNYFMKSVCHPTVEPSEPVTSTEFDDKDDSYWKNVSSEEMSALSPTKTPTITLDTKSYSGVVEKDYAFLAKSNIGEYISAKAADSSIVKVSQPQESEKGWLITLTGLKPGTTTINVKSACGVTTSFPVTYTAKTSPAIKNAGTFTVNTDSYTMAPGNIYQIGAKTTSMKSVAVQCYSSVSGVASVTKLKNGNYQIRGIKPGTTYIMFDIINGRTKFGHLSIRVDVKKGVKQGGQPKVQTVSWD